MICQPVSGVSILILIAVLAFALPVSASAASCKPSDPVGTVCTLNVARLHPTQFAVGSIAVACKAAKIAGKSRKKLEKYFAAEARVVPAVVGPAGGFYITDHHHLATALYRAQSSKWGDEDKVMRIRIIDSYHGRDLRWGEFWNAMATRNRSYNADDKGLADINYALLPQNVGGLLDDPYRTLSRWVRESCGYLKRGKTQCDAIRPEPAHAAPYFMEFYWGEFFRDNLPMPRADLPVCGSIPYSPTCLADPLAELKARYEPAMKLAASAAAKRYFEDLGLDPWEYGYNPGGGRVPIRWSGPDLACEAVDTD